MGSLHRNSILRLVSILLKTNNKHLSMSMNILFENHVDSYKIPILFNSPLVMNK